MAALPAAAQTDVPGTPPPRAPRIAVKWAPTGLIYGGISLLGEYNLGRNSVTAKIGIPVPSSRVAEYQNQDAEFTMEARSVMAGFRRYLGRRSMRGIYFEPYLKYVGHSSEGTGNGTLQGRPVVLRFTNEYTGLGAGAQLGTQFLIRRRVTLDLFLIGPEFNSARNSFRVVEVSNALPWTAPEAAEAEQDIRDFINDIPFIRNKTDIVVDRNNKTVLADFKGGLPGFRTGISVGIAF